MIVPKPKLAESLRVAAKNYHEQLLQDDEALEYLTKDRNFTSAAISHFGLGVVREAEKGHDHYLNRISFPYVTMTGVSSIRFRYLGDHKLSNSEKFLFLPGDTPRIYNVRAVDSSGKVYVCEGETDTITAWMAGFYSIGIPGVTSWKSAFNRVLRDREVVVLADNDDEGQGRKFAEKLNRELDGCDIRMMPKGHDVSSFVAVEGLEALKERVA